jgi:hypothetical protein
MKKFFLISLVFVSFAMNQPVYSQMVGGGAEAGNYYKPKENNSDHNVAFSFKFSPINIFSYELETFFAKSKFGLGMEISAGYFILLKFHDDYSINSSSFGLRLGRRVVFIIRWFICSICLLS